jgi:uncharacterized protein (DUF58 family)
MEKRDLALQAVAAIGFLTARVGNRFGAVLVEPSRIVEVPARQGRAHLMAILNRLQNAPRRDSSETADLAHGIRRLMSPGHRRGLAVVVSDLLAPDGWDREIARVALRHDVLVIELIDPRELELPDVGTLALVDPETGRLREVNTRSAKLRTRYADAAREQREANARAIRGAGADHLVLRTDSDWLLDIIRFVVLRRKRMEVRVSK